ncbi:uncharacterized protein BX663DRAFT_524989 [Cokeromyces recurvatus]|uniref:uncharacterized protein n=1 Tax=Cokeromyces recurvatus TaxID=90255 RepID=UPI00221EF1C6|nr:uncharacterized protein BX663DRAFT_524989 [Cokeromyces recurvatus]KAI7898501.1 hypothetical protein BX663DRAFT_524989 [Cokeromyces recurvatus]
MPNTKKPEDLDIPPAQVVGGMRVKQTDPRRIPLKEQTKDTVNDEQNEDEQQVLDQEEEFIKDQERMRQRALQERQARDMQSHTASRQANVNANPGTHVSQTIRQGIQPRSLNH